MRKRTQEVEHPRFDKVKFEVVFDPRKDGDAVVYQVFSGQAKKLLDVLAKAAGTRKKRELTGNRLREILECSRIDEFPRTRQKEIFRIFQDYRARFVRAGFLKIVED